MADSPRRSDPREVGGGAVEPPPEKITLGGGIKTITAIGWLMFTCGAIMLLLLFTPARAWALEHSIASLVAATDRRVGNTIETSVDEPIAIVGSVVVMFAGLWFGLLVPWVMMRWHKQRLAAYVDRPQG